MASPTYMQKQTDINVKMREILVDWLIEVHIKFKLQPETLFLTVNLIDRFLERRAVSRTKLQLVGCAAMLIAAKYEEIYAPEVRDFVYISDQAYNRDQILAMEGIMLNCLGFFITAPTCLRFAERLFRVGKVSPETENYIRYLMELTMQDSKFLRYRPSEIAAAATYLGMKTTGHQWDATVEHHSNYSRQKMNDVLVDLQELAARDPPKYRAVRKKYANKKYCEVCFFVVFCCHRFARFRRSPCASLTKLHKTTLAKNEIQSKPIRPTLPLSYVVLFVLHARVITRKVIYSS